MKGILAILLLLFAAAGGINRIAEINANTAKAQQAMAAGNYQTAIKSYELLLDSLKIEDDRARLNLAHAYFKAGRKEKAYKTYSALLKKKDTYLQSVSALQLGILSADFKDFPEALKFYKMALIIDPANEQARYNYELLKKYLKENPPEENEDKQIPPPAQDQQQKENSNKKEDEQGSEEQETDTSDPDTDNQQNPQQKPEQQGKIPEAPSTKPGKNQQGSGREKPEGNRQEEQHQGQEPGSEQGMGNRNEQEDNPAGQSGYGGRRVSDKDENVQTRYERLKQMNISPEKANMILDAMRESEQQYIQQLPRKGTAKRDRSKPDW